MVGWFAWIGEHGVLLTWLSVGSGVMLVASALLLPVLVARLPADYFVRPPRPPAHPVLRIVRNVVGFALVLAGIAMLVLPGQGVLTILAGLGLADFPCKRALELWIVRRSAVARGLQWLRRRRGCAPLVLGDE